MKQVQYILLLACSILALNSCEKAFLKPQPEVNNLEVFDDFSKIFLEKYAMFEQKGVDWPRLSDSVRATIGAETSQLELADKMGFMTIQLRDGHTSLMAGDSLYSFDLIGDAGLNFDFETWGALYVNENAISVGDVIQSQIIGDNIGYVFIQSFEGWETADLETILEPVKDTRGLIIDVRINGGGDPNLAGLIARRLTETAYPCGTEFFKTGPGANDFSQSEITVTPDAEGITYLNKPVAILQARLSYSATTTLIYLTDPNPNVATFGARSGGGSGSVGSGYLINGWTYNLSVSDYVDSRGRKIDDGVEPDFPVMVDPMDTSKDEVVEAAIAWINR